jgi:hypothetical protein
VSTCTEMTNFDTQLSVYSGSCDTLQCIAGNDDSACGASSTVRFFGAQGVTYHIRVHGFLEKKGEFGLTIEETNVALVACDEMKYYMDDPYTGSACECTANGQDAVLTCQDLCSYCNTDQSVCATKATVSAITASLQSSVTSKSATYTYTKGLDGVLEFETTGCSTESGVGGGGGCSACTVSFNGEQCNSCTPTQCGEAYSYPSFDIDCSNIDPKAVIRLCDAPAAIATGPLQVLTIDGVVGTCVRDPVDVCNSVKDYQMENYKYLCECSSGISNSSSSSSSATLTCSDPTCPMSCNLDYTVCWNDSFATIFDANGQQSSASEINAYIEGRDEVVVWEGRGYETCRVTVNGVACNSCGTPMCSNGSEREAVDCENIESGASLDTCFSYAVEGQKGVLEAFNDYENINCLTLSDPQAICQEEMDQNALWGTTCDCALDTITGEDYVLTCLGSCLSCNDEGTVCANQTRSETINRFGQRHSIVVSYTYVSGGRDETVVVGGLDYSGTDCYVTVNETPCNSCVLTTA